MADFERHCSLKANNCDELAALSELAQSASLNASIAVTVNGSAAARAAGAPLYVLKELGGWETLEMVNRYAHLAPEHLKAHAERLSLTEHVRHNGDAPEKSEVAVSS